MQILEHTNNEIVSQFVVPEVMRALTDFISNDEQELINSSAHIIAKAFYSQDDFDSILVSFSAKQDVQEKHYIESFQLNLELLVQKTWIDSTQENLKDRILFRIEGFCDDMRSKRYQKGYTGFLPILNDVVYLLFGSQMQQNDFLNYAFRIDPGFGIFWWFISNLPKNPTWSDEKCRLAVLLGMYFLLNF